MEGDGAVAAGVRMRMNEGLFQRCVFSTPLVLEPVLLIDEVENAQVGAALQEAQMALVALA